MTVCISPCFRGTVQVRSSSRLSQDHSQRLSVGRSDMEASVCEQTTLSLLYLQPGASLSEWSPTRFRKKEIKIYFQLDLLRKLLFYTCIDTRRLAFLLNRPRSQFTMSHFKYTKTLCMCRCLKFNIQKLCSLMQNNLQECLRVFQCDLKNIRNIQSYKQN